jgi:hypothetical protein
MKRIWSNAGVAAATLLLAGAALAGALPPVQHSGDISYLSGGIGLDESEAIKAAAPGYGLFLTFVSNIDGHGNFNAPEQVTVLKADGSPVLDLKPDGPFMLIDLPPGSYRITAGSASTTKTQVVQIARGGHKKLVFELPESGQ